jgi:hypothetical protein
MWRRVAGITIPLWICLGSAAACASPGSWFPTAVATRFDVVVFGETHGNEQSPEKFLDVVRAAVALGDGPVLVGLELPPLAVETARKAVDKLNNGEDGVLILSGSEFWSKARDGRTSKAQFGLIRALRSEEQQGSVSIVGFDMRVTGREDFGETASAAILMHATAGQKIVLLTGNGHAHLDASSASIARPFAIHGHSVLIVNTVHSGGLSWVCVGGVCGPHNMSPASRCPALLETRLIEVDGVTATQGEFCIGRITESPPALGQ